MKTSLFLFLLALEQGFGYVLFNELAIDNHPCKSENLKVSNVFKNIS